MSEALGLDMELCLEGFNSLLMKGLVSLDSKKDENDKYKEVVNIDNIYRIVEMEEEQNNEEEEIFKIFEEELGRTLSQTELALINGWLLSGTKEELIIDKIIYEWEKKGFTSMEEVNSYLKNRKSDRVKNDKEIEKREQEVLDYDWLNDDDK